MAAAAIAAAASNLNHNNTSCGDFETTFELRRSSRKSITSSHLLNGNSNNSSSSSSSSSGSSNYSSTAYSEFNAKSLVTNNKLAAYSPKMDKSRVKHFFNNSLLQKIKNLTVSP